MRILLCCDGGESLGVGHVMRSLALADEAVAAGHEVVVAGRFEGQFLASQLAAAPVEVVPMAAPMAAGDPQALVDLIGRLRPNVLHIDSYEAFDRLGGVVASSEVDAVVSNMEDGRFGRRAADVVIDPTIGAELSPRPEDGSTWLLRGARYALLRRQVVQRRGAASELSGAVRSVLVVMGGTDPGGLAAPVVAALGQTGLALEVTVIAEGENVSAVTEAAKSSGERLALQVLPPTDDLAALMSASDVVVSAAGSSAWELCCIGVPMALVRAADNQAEGYARLVGAGAALGLGGRADVLDTQGTASALREWSLDSVRRQAHARVGTGLVDGLGAWRVVQTWEQVLRLRRSPPQEQPNSVTARPAGIQDARLLWDWRNDPGTRAGARSLADVPFDDHVRWLTASLSRTDRLLLLVEDELGPVGTARWDLVGAGQWEVSTTVAPDRRGQSLSRPLLRAAETALSSATDATSCLAVIHVDNHASVRMIETSAWVPDLPPDPQGFMRFRKDVRVL